MRKNLWMFAIAAFLLAAPFARAQLSTPGTQGKAPVEISAEGGTHFENGIAYAEKGVIIRHEGTTIYCDSAEYDTNTRDILLKGNVRIYNQGRLTTADRAVYNLDTKKIHAASITGESYPFEFSGESLDTLNSSSSNSFLVHNAIFTTSDSSKPDWHLRAKTMRIYSKDRVVLTNATLYIGQTPVFWVPYYYQNLNNNAFSFAPGYDSIWGAFLLSQYTFPVSKNIIGHIHFDLRSKRGVGIGFDSEFHYGKENKSWGRFKSYYIDDLAPGTNETALARGAIPNQRYRISLQSRLYVTDDIYANINLNKLSDPKILEDFFQNEYRNDPQPDNYISLTKWNENYTLTAILRQRVNDFYEMTERTPEIALDIKRQPIFGSPFFYQGETSAVHLRRDFADGSLSQDYSATRFDTFHQILYPNTYFGWLSVIPRVGIRGTYYDRTGHYDAAVDPLTASLMQQNQSQISSYGSQLGNIQQQRLAQRKQLTELQAQPYSPENQAAIAQTQSAIDASTTSIETLQGAILSAQSNLNMLNREPLTGSRLVTGGSTFRTTINAGVSASFKLSREYKSVDSRLLGLDGLRHVMQPYTNFSFVTTSRDPNNILQFDRVIPTTQIQPLDFPEFNRIDSISNWTVWRFGVQNRLETRRNNQTLSWLEMDSYVDLNIQPPKFPGLEQFNQNTFSNVFNNIRLNPVPWMSLEVDSQLPLIDKGFTEVNTTLGVLVTRNLRVNLSHRYLDGNPFFDNSSYFVVSGYYRLNDNWGVGASEQYELKTNTLESQQYQIYRDLSSWVASLGFLVRNNGVNSNYGVLLTFTLKGVPQIALPLSFDPTGLTNNGSGSGKNE